jgi:peptide/nickel transport system permease protein
MMNITQSKLKKFLGSDFIYAFSRSPLTILATIVCFAIIISAILAPWIAPQNPLDLASLDLLDASTPPVWYEDGNPQYVLGTDNQGRDVLSAILYGTRVSLAVGFASVIFAMIIGIFVGLLSGYKGGRVDMFFMRIADIQMTFPAILIALLVDGIFRGIMPREMHEHMAIYVLIFSIGISNWVQFARTVRGSVMVEKSREYVQAGRVIGRSSLFIMFKHILPNVMGPVFVIATINLGLAVILEATLSFLGVGLPPTEPSLGTLIRVGNEFLFSGEWWTAILPGLVLALLVLSVNLLGDWLRDVLNPKLK